jgi:hypothetical protein
MTGEKGNELAQPVQKHLEVGRFLDIGATSTVRVAGDLPDGLQHQAAAAVDADDQELVGQMCFPFYRVERFYSKA